MLDRRILFFSYLPPDAKAAEAALNRWAERGWALRWLHLGFACLRRTDRRDLRYCVELRPRRGLLEDDDALARWEADYLQLCADAGWDLAVKTAAFYIFASVPGARPAPLQTDSALDFEEHWRGFLHQLQMSALAPVLGAAVGLLYDPPATAAAFRSPWRALLSASTLGAAVCLALLLGGELGYFFWLHAFRRRCLRALEAGEGPPAPTRWGARLRGLGGFLALPVLVLTLAFGLTPSGDRSADPQANAARMADLPVLRAADVGAVPQGLYPSYLITEDSPFLTHVEAGDYGADPAVLTDYYRACAPGLARTIAADLMEGEAAPADLGFDESWLWTDGEGRAVLLLREGNTVARLSAAADLTSAGALSVIRDRLGLEGTT